MKRAMHKGSNPLLAVAGAALLTACASPPPKMFAPEPERPQAQRYKASFDCMQPETPWQAYVCRDATLAASDQQLHAAWLRQLRGQDQVGRAELLASQRHWQLGLYPQCGLTDLPAENAALAAAPLACLQQAWQARTQALQSMALPAVVQADSPQQDHPLAAYVALREVQSLAPGLCEDLGARLNGLIAQHGELNPARVPGWHLLAGSHGTAQASLPDGRVVEVLQHDAGPYGSYELRATGLRLNGVVVLTDRSVPAWMFDLPNAGGSFSSTSSQTGDYASIDVFQHDTHRWVLVTQTWGYYASAARGESPHAALYEIDGQGLQRRCLWRSYTTPPVAQALRFLPQFKALQGLLDTMAGPDSLRIAPEDRRDAGLLYAEAQWQRINMPLLGVREAHRHGRWPQLRQRHDEALEAVFAWSERNVASKQLYRRFMPLIPAAHAELQKAFQGNEGMKPDEARAAADLLLMDALARAAEHLQDPAQPRTAWVGRSYAARYAVAPAPGDLEKGRAYSGLHSALLNRAPPEVLNDFLNATRVGDPALGLGPAGDTPLMAAVRSPDTVARLLAAGADVNATNAWGKTALMSAAQADQFDCVQGLLQAGANPLARTVVWQADGAGGLDNAEGALPGHTALLHAAATAQAAVIDALLAAGSDRKAVDAKGRSACELLTINPRVPAAEGAGLRARLCEKP